MHERDEQPAGRDGAQPEPRRRHEDPRDAQGGPDRLGHAELGLGARAWSGSRPPAPAASCTQAGLTVGSQTSACSSQPSGVVSAQNPGRRHQRPAQHPGQPRRLDRQLRLGPGRRGQSQAAATSAITGAGLVANTTFDTACPERGPAGQRRQPEPGGQRAGQQREHGQHLGVPVGDHDHRRRPRRPRRRPARAPSTTTSSNHGRGTARTETGLLPGRRSGGGGGASWPRKLASRAGPDTVRTDSGWNCTPSTAQRAVAQPHHHAVGRGGGHLELVGHRVGVAPPASGSGWRRRGWGARRRCPVPSWWISEVLPCIRCGAATMLPP